MEVSEGDAVEFKYLHEFETDLKKHLRHGSKVHVGSIHSNKRPKIPGYFPFKYMAKFM
jgi:hypothetical protein